MKKNQFKHLFEKIPRLLAQGEYLSVLEVAEKLLGQRDDIPELWYWYGIALKQKNKRRSFYAFKRAAGLTNLVDALNSIAVELMYLATKDALGLAEKILLSLAERNTSDSSLLFNLSLLRYKQHKLENARELIFSVIDKLPSKMEAYILLSKINNDLSRSSLAGQALQFSKKALEIDAKNVFAYFEMARAASKLKQYDIAVNAYKKILALDDSYEMVLGSLFHSYMLLADWGNTDEIWKKIINGLRKGKNQITPFAFIGASADPELSYKNAVLYSKSFERQRIDLRPIKSGEKIRIGYVSGEFRDHATSILMVEMLECQDKARFELIAFDNGWDDGSEIRARLEEAVDAIYQISNLSDDEVCELITSENIEILVNLNGYFGIHRTNVFAMRPAPVQVNFLGFPGTLGGFMDYIVADLNVLPVNEAEYYSERIAYVDGCYQPNDSSRYFPTSVPKRTERSLPADAFVFACFNNTYKITPEAFSSWMRILREVEHAVLWLLADSDAVKSNLSKNAFNCGVDPSRLVFASREPYRRHLERLLCADLFLDTWPYGAHTTASDALWVGVPVLTYVGTTFPGRVGASLLRGLGVDELVTENVADYEHMAIRLASEPRLLGELKDKLDFARTATDVFSGKKYAQKIDALFDQMSACNRRGQLEDILYSG